MMAVTPVLEKPLAALAAGLKAALGENLVSATLYGSAARGLYQVGHSDVNVLVVLTKIDAAALAVLRDVLKTSATELTLSPYLVASGELPRLAEAFPTRVLEMKRGYVVLAGADVLAEVQVDRTALALRCRQELLNIVMRVRHRLLRQDGATILGDELEEFLASFIKTLRTLVYLTTGTHIDERAEVIRGAGRFGLPEELFMQLLAWRQGQLALDENELRAALMGFFEGVEKVSDAVGAARV